MFFPAVLMSWDTLLDCYVELKKVFLKIKFINDKVFLLLVIFTFTQISMVLHCPWFIYANNILSLDLFFVYTTDL